MKQLSLALAFVVITQALVAANAPTNAPATNGSRTVAVRFPRAEVKYPLGPDSQRKEGVPRGKITDFDWTESKVFPGTIRRCSIYVPAQYDGTKPAALMVFQDGHTYMGEAGDFRVPIVFDNLIASREMPVTIAVFIDPGFTQKEFPSSPRGWQPEPRNRSFEYRLAQHELLGVFDSRNSSRDPEAV